jgi:hypothetical protein
MKALLVIGSIVAALAAAGTAAAAGENGATVTNDSGCITSSFTISCWDVKLVTETTTTPSGNVSYLTNGTLQKTVSIPLLGCTYTQTQPIHDHELVKDGESHMFSRRFTDITSFGCGGGPVQTCTLGLAVHWVNGGFQFERPEFVCTTD